MDSRYLLCLNVGSSSLKFKLFDLSKDGTDIHLDQLQAVALGTAKPKEDNSTGLFLSRSKSEQVNEVEVKEGMNSSEMLERILSTLSSDVGFSSDSIAHISHRIVHGAHLSNCLEISPTDAKNLETIEFLSSFAPLHNGPATSMIRNALKILPRATNYCCFDTYFHVVSMDEVRYRYPVREDAAGRGLPGGMSLRKWGFHGLSYSSVIRSVARYLDKEESNLNLIVCHLGSGASICAVKAGKSFDTSMGLTPLDGLPGSSRSGSVDPTLSHHIRPFQDTPAERKYQQDTHEKKLKVDVGEAEIDQAEYILNAQSGFLAIAGTSDFAEIVKKRKVDAKCSLAFDIFVDRIIGYLGSYSYRLASYEGVQALVFSGGIGEGSPDLHAALADKLQNTSISMLSAEETSGGKGAVTRMQDESGKLKPGSIPWLICKTDEEEECARQVVQHLQHRRG